MMCCVESCGRGCPNDLPGPLNRDAFVGLCVGESMGEQPSLVVVVVVAVVILVVMVVGGDGGGWWRRSRAFEYVCTVQ